MMLFLLGGFFRGQVVQYQKYATQSETNRTREIPLPAARGVIYDRNGQMIADNVVGYSVSVLALREDSLRSILKRLGEVISISLNQTEQAVRRLRQASGRPTVIIGDAGFDVVSAPGWDGNRFVGGIPAQYWDSLRNDPRKPLYNKALQGEYPPGSPSRSRRRSPRSKATW